MSEPSAACFYDPAIQAESPQAELLHLLRSLTGNWSEEVPRSHGEERALSVLAAAGGLQARGGRPWESYGRDGEVIKKRSWVVRLTVSGLRWQACLIHNEAAEPVKARGAVLAFVMDAYRQTRRKAEPTAAEPDTATDTPRPSQVGGQEAHPPASKGPLPAVRPKLGQGE